MKQWCPRCNQGWVFNFRHRQSGERVCVCVECEALWNETQDITAEAFSDLRTYFDAKGQPGEWSELDRLEDGS